MSAYRYQIKFLEIESDEDHVHFLVQSVPIYRVTKLVTMMAIHSHYTVAIEV